jgi:hypothetical protein
VTTSLCWHSLNVSSKNLLLNIQQHHGIYSLEIEISHVWLINSFDLQNQGVSCQL